MPRKSNPNLRLEEKQKALIGNPDISFVAGWLIDGTGRPSRENVFVRIRDGRIREISANGDRDSAFDFSDCTILPGLVDSHVHLFMSGTSDRDAREHQLVADYLEVRDSITRRLENALSCGVIAVRDGGDGNGHALRYKNEFSEAESVIVKAAGRAWRKPGRYGKLIGGPVPEGETLARAVEKNRDSGCDHAKIVNSGLNSLKQFGRQTPPQFYSEEMKQAVKTAKSLGLKVMVHANGEIPVRIAADAGCDSVEHGFFMGRDNLARMADKGVFWTPTAFTMKGYAENPGGADAEINIAKRNLDHQLEQIRMARELGVFVAVGTDAGSLGVHHGFAVIEELGLLMTAGFSIEEAVKCASRNGSALLGLDGGVLSVGEKASFITVPGPPADLPQSLKKVRAVYKCKAMQTT